jgi:hypothetical protein
MPGPFPGMDPFLEAPDLWQEFHDRLIFHLGSVLQEALPSGYIAAFGQRVEVLLTGPRIGPDIAVTRVPHVDVIAPAPRGHADPATVIEVEPEEVTERFVQILRVPQRTLVGVIEIASPTNKLDPRGRAHYQEKQRTILDSDAHLVEVDLLRAGAHWAAVPLAVVKQEPSFDYLICVSRAGQRQRYECYFRTVRQRLPTVAVPLADGDPEAALDLQEALDRAHDQGQYRQWMSYAAPIEPPLRPDDEAWARDLLRAEGCLPATD